MPLLPRWKTLIVILQIWVWVALTPFLFPSSVQAQVVPVSPTLETEPVLTSDDAADDAAIWLHPSDLTLSTIIGTDKQNSLHVYDLMGTELQFIAEVIPNNVDLRYNFPLGGTHVALVGVSNVVTPAGLPEDSDLHFFRVDPTTRLLEDVTAQPIITNMDDTVYGFCMYHSPVSGKYYAFVSSRSKDVQQWEVFDNGNGQVAATLARSFQIAGRTEGCVADDELAVLYLAEEQGGIWKYGAEPGDGTTATLVDVAGGSGQYTGVAKGLTIYYASDGTGYLIASNQSKHQYEVYTREGSNAHVMTFEIVEGPAADGTTLTDGIDVTNRPLGPNFLFGAFVAQDDSNDDGNQNFKLVPWETIAKAASPPLTVDATWDPRQVGVPGGGNVQPTVDAGPDQTVVLPASVSLNGTVSDDGLPNPPASVAITWSKVSGPGTVTFGPANVEDTTATFSEVGNYVLRLTADDNALQATDEIAVQVIAAEATVGIWDRFEATIPNSNSYGDPYQDVTLNVTYTRPDQSTVDFWGFYDGGAIWKIRFMPDQLGVWTYDATFSDGTPAITGTFTCMASAIPGMLSRDESNPRWFGFKGGNHVLVRSFHVGDRFFAENWDDPLNPDDGNKRTLFLDWAEAQGYNMLSIASHYLRRNVDGRGLGWDTPDLWPLNASEYRKMEVILDDLESRGIMIFPFAGFIGKHTETPRGLTEQTQYIRYTLARIGSYWNLLFNIMGPEMNRRDDVQELGILIQSLDVFGHPLSVHNGNGDFKNSTWSTYVAGQGFKMKDDLSGVYEGLLTWHNGSKPVYAQEVFWPGNHTGLDWTADQVRKKAFVLMMAAMTINFGDMDGNSSTGFGGSMDLADRHQDWHDAIKGVWDYFETVPFYRMNPCQNLVNNGFCLAEPGQRYLVYLPNGGSVDVVLTQARFDVTWVNARDTDDRRSGGVTIDGQGLTAPIDGDDWILDLALNPAINFPPSPDAGPDQTVSDADDNANETVTLDGSGSMDANGIIVSYDWSKGGSSIATGVNPTVTLALGMHTLTLTVMDDEGASSSDEVVVAILPNQAPTANAGPDQTIPGFHGSGQESVLLDGSLSSDPDGLLTAYEWREGQSLLGTDPTATVSMGIGSHIVTLTVTDNAGATATDTVLITINPNQPPVAMAGQDQTVFDKDSTGKESVTLNGSQSIDTDGQIIQYEWRWNDLILGVSPILQVPAPIGNYTVTLTVTDNGGATASDTVDISVQPNVAPLADAGTDRTVHDGDGSGSEPVTLNGSASSDSDGTITKYEWKKGPTVLGSAAQLTTILGVGVHLLTLTVTDDGGSTSTDNLVVTVMSNEAPVANAGPDQTATFDVPAVFNASASTDSDGTLVGYEWNFGDGATGSGVSVSHLYPRIGTYTAVLTVTDNGGSTHSDALTVTVNTLKNVFVDSFEVAEWNGLWTEDSQDRWFRSPRYAIEGGYSAEIVGSEGSAEGTLTSIPINLQGRNNATISFSWYFERFESSEYLAFDISVDGGATWREMARLQGNVDPEDIWHAVSLSVQNITGLLIRFRSQASKANEYADLDAVRVTGW